MGTTTAAVPKSGTKTRVKDKPYAPVLVVMMHYSIESRVASKGLNSYYSGCFYKIPLKEMC